MLGRLGVTAGCSPCPQMPWTQRPEARGCPVCATNNKNVNADQECPSQDGRLFQAVWMEGTGAGFTQDFKDAFGCMVPGEMRLGEGVEGGLGLGWGGGTRGQKSDSM